MSPGDKWQTLPLKDLMAMPHDEFIAWAKKGIGVDRSEESKSLDTMTSTELQAWRAALEEDGSQPGPLVEAHDQFWPWRERPQTRDD